MVFSGLMSDNDNEKRKLRDVGKEGGRGISISRPMPLGQAVRTSWAKTSEANGAGGATVSVSRNGVESTAARIAEGNSMSKSSSSNSGFVGSGVINGIGNTSQAGALSDHIHLYSHF